MSGICGIVNFDGAPVNPGALDRMVQAGAHRGPDGVGRWLNGKAGLATLRTNITPEAVRERQPECSPGHAFVLTASARIDNRSDLIAALKDRLREQDPTDADLILAAFGKWGEDCVRHLIGDYAFAIWDAPREVLFAARDPMGFRPLYYRHAPGRFEFASEVRQLLARPGGSADLSERAIAMHLTMVTPPESWSFFEGVHQLPAGHALRADSGGLRTWRSWEVEPEARIVYRSEDDYVDHFREIFQEAVRARLRSRRPVGIWLSGGLDSGSVASTAGWLRQREAGHPSVRTYAWSFESLPQCDERQVSDRISAHFGLPAGYVSAEEAAPFSETAPVVTHPDGPLDQFYSPLLERALSRARQDGVGIILSGFRGDPVAESGRFDYLDLVLAGRWLLVLKHLFLYKRRVPYWPLGRLARDRFGLPFAEAILWSRAAAWAAYPLRERLRGRTSPYPALPYPEWVEPAFALRNGLRRRVQRARPGVPVRGLARGTRYRSIFHPKLFRAAVEQERLNATAGIGYADPWSDRRIAEYVLSVPQQVLSRIGDEKRIIRQAMRGIMPEDARLAARKVTARPLYDRVMRSEGRREISRLFDGSRLAARGFIDEGRLRDRYHRYLSGGEEDPRLWSAVTAELWLRRHFS